MREFPYGTVQKIQREYTLDDIYGHMDRIRNLGMNYVVNWPVGGKRLAGFLKESFIWM